MYLTRLEQITLVRSSVRGVAQAQVGAVAPVGLKLDLILNPRCDTDHSHRPITAAICRKLYQRTDWHSLNLVQRLTLWVIDLHPAASRQTHWRIGPEAVAEAGGHAPPHPFPHLLLLSSLLPSPFPFPTPPLRPTRGQGQR